MWQYVYKCKDSIFVSADLVANESEAKAECEKSGIQFLKLVHPIGVEAAPAQAQPVTSVWITKFGTMGAEQMALKLDELDAVIGTAARSKSEDLVSMAKLENDKRILINNVKFLEKTLEAERTTKSAYDLTADNISLELAIERVIKFFKEI